MKKLYSLLFFVVFFISVKGQPTTIWSPQHANDWYGQHRWIVGCNFIPSTAINELEMWQAETFDAATIDRELGWAHEIGMNAVRVFLHYLPWHKDSKGYRKRINTYLSIAEKNKIKTIFVFFDDCWNAFPKDGKQSEPKPGIHNSGWVQSPGKNMHDDSTSWSKLENYEKDILTSFRKDDRVLMWDLYNEPGNGNYNETSFPLLKDAFKWAWSVRPSQPITAGIWYDNQVFNEWQIDHSDVISFHNYGKTEELEKEIKALIKYKRPIICTEYMARTRGSKFETHLPIFKKYNVGAINWGLVSGKTNTIYQWDTPIPDGSEPKIWFHDIFRKDGQPYDKKETEFIKQIVDSK
jgi:Glycosyl hydrolases family 2, TIM barrel domain